MYCAQMVKKEKRFHYLLNTLGKDNIDFNKIFIDDNYYIGEYDFITYGKFVDPPILIGRCAKEFEPEKAANILKRTIPSVKDFRKNIELIYSIKPEILEHIKIPLFEREFIKEFLCDEKRVAKMEKRYDLAVCQITQMSHLDFYTLSVYEDIFFIYSVIINHDEKIGKDFRSMLLTLSSIASNCHPKYIPVTYGFLLFWYLNAQNLSKEKMEVIYEVSNKLLDRAKKDKLEEFPFFYFGVADAFMYDVPSLFNVCVGSYDKVIHDNLKFLKNIQDNHEKFFENSGVKFIRNVKLDKRLQIYDRCEKIRKVLKVKEWLSK